MVARWLVPNANVYMMLCIKCQQQTSQRQRIKRLKKGSSHPSIVDLQSLRIMGSRISQVSKVLWVCGILMKLQSNSYC